LDFSNMNRAQLLQYMKDFVDIIEKSDVLSEEDMDFINIQKRAIWELSHDRIYKVSTAYYNTKSSSQYTESDVKYFSSVNAAKREIKQRLKKLLKNPYVAGPDEVSDSRMVMGIAPNLVTSVISNAQVPLRTPGRFKFYEVRMVTQKRKVVPIQFILAEVQPIPLEHPEDARFTPSGVPNNKIIPFKKVKHAKR